MNEKELRRTLVARRAIVYLCDKSRNIAILSGSTVCRLPLTLIGVVLIGLAENKEG